MTNFDLIFFTLIGLLLLIVFFYVMKFRLIWLRAHNAKAPITGIEIFSLQLRSVPVGKIVDTRIILIQKGIDVSYDDLSTHHIAGGNIANVAAGMIKAKEKNLKLSFDQACAFDLQDQFPEY